MCVQLTKTTGCICGAHALDIMKCFVEKMPNKRVELNIDEHDMSSAQLIIEYISETDKTLKTIIRAPTDEEWKQIDELQQKAIASFEHAVNRMKKGVDH